MKKAIIIAIAMCGLLVLTTCGDWYENTDNFENVLTSGVWETVEYYKQPDPSNPGKESSKFNLLNDDNSFIPEILIFKNDGSYDEYSKLVNSTEKYIINKSNGDSLFDVASLYFFEIKNKWKLEENKLLRIQEDSIQSFENENSYIIENYSNDIIKLYSEQEIYVDNLDNWQFGDTIIPKDTFLIKTYIKYKNVSDKYLVP